MPFFHVTYDRHIVSILRYGLGGMITERNFPESIAGVYLADEPVIAIGFMIEHMMDTALDTDVPSDYLKSWRIIVIDDSRVDQSKLRPDPQILIDGFWLYDGIIDVNGLPILTFDQLGTPPC